MAEAVQQQRQLPALLPAEVPLQLSKDYDVDQAGWIVLKRQIFPNATDVNVIELALALCKKNKYDPFKKPYHIVKTYENGKEIEQVWPGFNSLLITAHRTGEFAGVEKVDFGPEIKFAGQMVPSSATATVKRLMRDGSHAEFTAEVFYTEQVATKKDGTPNRMWKKSPKQQLGKCAKASALRMAFPEEMGGMYCQEEMEGQEFGAEENLNKQLNERAAEIKSERNSNVPPIRSDNKSFADRVQDIKADMRQDEKDRAQAAVEVSNMNGDFAAAADAQQKVDELKGIEPKEATEINRVATQNGWPMKAVIDHIASACNVPSDKRSQWPKFVTEEKRLEILAHISKPYVEDVEATE